MTSNLEAGQELDPKITNLIEILSEFSVVAMEVFICRKQTLQLVSGAFNLPLPERNLKL